ncbi:hypothetical protein ACWGI9_09795 [Streptomyces sp. NPDC054833]
MTTATARVVRCATFHVLHGRRLQQDGHAQCAHIDAAGDPLSEAVTSLDADVLALPGGVGPRPG